jgi:hypothetical protein
MRTLRIAALVGLAFATATPARAADTTVTTVGKPTTIDAWAGRTFSEIRRVELHTLNERRATTRINTPEERVARATTGFAQDRGTSWYVRVPRQDVFEIHRATGLKYEDAPPPRPPHG